MKYYGPHRGAFQTWSDFEEGILCELLAEGLSLAECAKALGRTYGSVVGKFHRIRAAMGAQAV